MRIKKELSSMKAKLTKIEEECEEFESKQKVICLERVRRRKEVDRKEQQQRERKQTLEEERSVQEERKGKLLLLNHEHSCLLAAGEEEKGMGISIVHCLAEFTGLEETMHVEEMLNVCLAMELRKKKKYLQHMKRDGERKKEKLKQEKDELLHQLHVYRGCVDEHVMNRLGEEQQEKDQLQTVQSIICQDLECCEVGK